MFDILKKISGFFVLIGIYLYFTAFVYLNFYWGLFGLSPTAAKIDYAQYLVYSYDVLSSSTFSMWAYPIISVILLLWFLVDKKLLQKPGSSKQAKKKIAFYSNVVVIIVLVCCFPFLFKISRSRAVKDYNNIRKSQNTLKNIQFIFRKNAEYLSPEKNIDSISKSGHVLSHDISVLKNDSNQSLRLLGETDEYYLVLRQPRYIKFKTDSVLPDGSVYYVAKSDVLLAKIILN